MVRIVVPKGGCECELDVTLLSRSMKTEELAPDENSITEVRCEGTHPDKGSSQSSAPSFILSSLLPHLIRHPLTEVGPRIVKGQTAWNKY